MSQPIEQPKVRIPRDAVLREAVEVKRLTIGGGFTAIYDYERPPCRCCGLGGRAPHMLDVIIVRADLVEIVDEPFPPPDAGVEGE